MSSREGSVDFIIGDKIFKTWYLVVGDLKSGKIPLVLLHGGPGFSHHYMLADRSLYEKAGIPLVFYDQIGNGNSSHVKDAPKDFWKPELFMDQLNGLLSHLGISDSFDLLGHSWGGMLAGRQLRRELLERGTDSLLKSQFLPDIYDIIEKHEREGTTDEKDYQDVVGQFMRKHVCTVDPWPAVFLQSLGELEKDNTVYHTMWGPSEFSITGTMRGWTIIDILHRISAPLDEVQSIAVMPWFLNVPKVKWVELQNSTHLAQFEEPEKYFDVILAFLERS
ncbi:hypothetical protein AAF712_006001 [Marasmius tenuissimus]|uniref:AB hydrolase-1 domain-containing protein n=1 Tax=Marasmius tenuissimus TaxID=585030 RepID=A0ABR3A101_9AGAR